MKFIERGREREILTRFRVIKLGGFTKLQSQNFSPFSSHESLSIWDSFLLLLRFIKSKSIYVIFWDIVFMTRSNKNWRTCFRFTEIVWIVQVTYLAYIQYEIFVLVFSLYFSEIYFLFIFSFASLSTRCIHQPRRKLYFSLRLTYFTRFSFRLFFIHLVLFSSYLRNLKREL